MLSVGSLFSGHGQLDYGLHLAGGFEHLWFCEADPWRREILALRWPGVPIFDDVRAVDGSAPRVDLLVGGFPCKGGSTAGNRAGLEHPETALWWEMARVIRLLRPRLVLIENVANLLTVPPEQPGRAWGEVLGELASQRYVCSWDCLPAAAFGAPHLRDRVFLVAAHADELTERQCLKPRASRRAASGGEGKARENLRADLGRGAAADSGGTGRKECDGSQSGGSQQPAADSLPAPNADGYRLRQQPEPERGSSGSAEPGGADADAADSSQRRLKAEPQQDCEQRSGLTGPLGDDPDGLRLRAGGEGVAPCGCFWGVIDDWGEYGPAIQRWEEIAGPAPEPLLRGLDARDARRVVRSQLSAYGDGVHLGPAVFLGHRIRELAEEWWPE